MVIFFTSVFVLSGIFLTLWAWSKWKAVKRRKKLFHSALSEEYREILRDRFPVFERLPNGLQTRLEGCVQVFLDEKRFEPCGGIEEITDEIRVLVAAQACLLLLGMEKPTFFPKLRSILIYPGAYRDRGRRVFDLRESDETVRLGESWNSGSVVLSWENVLAGAARDDDGMNVVYHEFAHQLDQIDAAADGAPPLPHRGDYASWARVFRREFEALVEAANDPRSDPLLDTYGAENPAEFFAVATETFFEMPSELQEEHEELYEQLANYFRVDPVSWEEKK